MELKDIVKREFAENDESLCFQSTPISKILVLSVLSGGIYDIILAYSWWKSLKLNFGYKIFPFWRGFFCVFTNFKLFPIFEKYTKIFNTKGEEIKGIALALLYFLMVYMSVKLEIKAFRLELKNQLDPIIAITIDLFSLLFTLASALILVSVQKKINKTNEQYFPNSPKNPWKKSNIIWAVILAILTILGLLSDLISSLV